MPPKAAEWRLLCPHFPRILRRKILLKRTHPLTGSVVIAVSSALESTPPGCALFVLILMYTLKKQTKTNYFTATLSKCQMSCTYSLMVLSEVNFPLEAVLMRAFFAHSGWLR